MSQFPNAVPGIGPGSLTLTPRTLFICDTVSTSDFLPSGRLIDGFSARDPDSGGPVTELRPGLLLGLINSTQNGQGSAVIGLWGASVIGTVTASIAAGTITAITLGLANAAELVRRGGSSGTLVLTNSTSAAGTATQTNIAYQSVNTTTGVITTTGSANSVLAGAWIGVADGTQIPLTVFCGNVFPIRVTDQNGNNMPTPLPLISISTKPYDVSNIINYPASANTGLIAFLKSKIRIPVPGATFSDDFG